MCYQHVLVAQGGASQVRAVTPTLTLTPSAKPNRAQVRRLCPAPHASPASAPPRTSRPAPPAPHLPPRPPGGQVLCAKAANPNPSPNSKP